MTPPVSLHLYDLSSSCNSKGERNYKDCLRLGGSALSLFINNALDFFSVTCAVYFPNKHNLLDSCLLKQPPSYSYHLICQKLGASKVKPGKEDEGVQRGTQASNTPREPPTIGRPVMAQQRQEEPWDQYLDENNRLQFFNATQRDALGIVTLVTAPLSVLGSLLICYAIATQKRGNASPPFERIMLGLSITDIIAGVSMTFGPWAIPKSERAYDVSFAQGTFRSCEWSGFFLTFWFGTMVYTAMLCLYYAAVICYEKNDTWTGRYIEPAAHILGFGYPLFMGIFGLHTELFSPIQALPGFCTVAVHPFGCTYVDGLECERGTDVSAQNLSYYINVGMLGLVWIIILGSMAKIVSHVRSTEKRMSRFSFGERSLADFQRTRRAFHQALLYVGTCTATAMPVIVAQSIFTGATSPLANLIITALAKSLSPLQGFFNAMIYFRNYPHVFRQGGSLYFSWCHSRSRPKSQQSRHSSGLALHSGDSRSRWLASSGDSKDGLGVTDRTNSSKPMTLSKFFLEMDCDDKSVEDQPHTISRVPSLNGFKEEITDDLEFGSCNPTADSERIKDVSKEQPE